MIPLPDKNRPGARDLSERRPAGILRNEGGFILAFVMFLLAVCTLLGLAASQSSLDETIISSNEVITKKVYTLALSGLPLAAVPLLKTQGRGTWTDGTFLLDADPGKPGGATSAIEILDGQFLLEGRDEDSKYGTGWNSAGKYLCADTTHKAAYKPIDDPFQAKKADGTLYDASINNVPDLRINVANLLDIDIDVDKGSVKYLAGGVAEFGSGADGGAGAAYQLTYIFDCKATVPGYDITSADAPTAEVILGYRFIPDSGI